MEVRNEDTFISSFLILLSLPKQNSDPLLYHSFLSLIFKILYLLIYF